MLLRFSIFAILSGFSFWNVLGQPSYPKGYFQNPLQIPLFLAGNFGEFRPNHFHTGLDFKTNQVEDLPVYAAADGFVSRIAVSHSGYGYCLYLQHPNGFTSVYAHLNAFDARISDYLLQQQRQQEKWNVDVTIDSPLLVYRKGEQIALSGNTGGSVAPHLHFEIRNTITQKVINGQHFQFDLEDKIAPSIYKIGAYDAARSVYLQAPQVLDKNAISTRSTPLEVPYSKIRIGIVAEDFMNNSTNTLGVYKTELYSNDVLVYKTEMDELDFSHSKCINGYTDYKYRATTQDWMQVLYRSANNPLSFYKVLENDGVIDLQDGQAKRLKLVLSDFQNNTSSLTWEVVYVPQQASKPAAAVPAQSWYSLYGQFLLNDLAFYDVVSLHYRLSKPVNMWSYRLHLHQNDIPLAQAQELFVKLLHPLPFGLHSKLVFKHEVKAQSLPGAQAQRGKKASFKKGYAYAKINTLGDYYVAIDTIAPQLSVVHNTKEKLVIKATEETTNITSFKAFMNGKFVVFSRKGDVFTCDKRSLYETTGTMNLEVQDENDNIAKLSFPVQLH